MNDKQRDLTRRGFLRQGAGAAAAGGFVVIAARGDDDEPETVALTLSEYEELKEVGGSVQAELPDGTQILVMRVEEQEFRCVGLKCTHANCNVEYDPRKKRVMCKCHNSLFDLDGNPIAGPAKRPLGAFPTDMAVVVRMEE